MTNDIAHILLFLDYWQFSIHDDTINDCQTSARSLI